jgi:hypothetical protein
MPDITMCHDERCMLAQECYRFKARPSEQQSYFSESPRTGDNCELFIQAVERWNKTWRGNEHKG